MRSFLIKVSIYLLVIFSVIGSVVIYYYETSKLPFFTNSVSFNAKAKFILENENYFKDCKYFVIGSSMSLNNIDSEILSDSIRHKTINLASWGMKFSDFNDFNIWDTNKVVIINIHFSDFGQSLIKKKNGYPYSGLSFFSYLNILQDFGSYYKDLNKYKSSLDNHMNDYYESLNFNNSGSLIFCKKEKFNISADRWELNSDIPTEKDLQYLVNSISVKSKSVKKIVISFSPGRQQGYTKQKADFINQLASYLGSMPNVVFFNNYNVKGFDDEAFVDHSHFSEYGAKIYTELLSRQINELHIE